MLLTKVTEISPLATFRFERRSNCANVAPDLDVITFGAGISGQTINLTMGALNVATSLNLIGPGADQLTIDGGGTSRIFFASDNTISVVDVEISGLTLTGGNAFAGGAIQASENLTIRESVFYGNSADNRGGAVSASQTLRILDSSFFDNIAQGSGGAVSAILAETSIYDSTFSNNSAGGGGAISAGRGTLTVESSTFSNNVSDGSGGAVSWSAGQLDIRHSTITGNVADANDDGSGYGGGLFVSGGGTWQMNHTIVAGNTDRSDIAPDIGLADGMAVSHSLIGDSTGALFLDLNGNVVGTAAEPVDPRLGPLTDNGGPTLTHALRIGSPARNAGDPTFAGPPDFDQRGMGFARVKGGRIDIGAVETGKTAGATPVFGGDLPAVRGAASAPDTDQAELLIPAGGHTPNMAPHQRAVEFIFASTDADRRQDSDEGDADKLDELFAIFGGAGLSSRDRPSPPGLGVLVRGHRAQSRTQPLLSCWVVLVFWMCAILRRFLETANSGTSVGESAIYGLSDRGSLFTKVYAKSVRVSDSHTLCLRFLAIYFVGKEWNMPKTIQRSTTQRTSARQVRPSAVDQHPENRLRWSRSSNRSDVGWTSQFGCRQKIPVRPWRRPC